MLTKSKEYYNEKSCFFDDVAWDIGLEKSAYNIDYFNDITRLLDLEAECYARMANQVEGVDIERQNEIDYLDATGDFKF